LNQCLETGPRLQPDLVAILLRFRRSKVALQADIEKMYLQIGLRPEDRDVCRFLWQEAGAEAPVKTYRLTRVGFGLACSPFLAMQVVRQHARQCGEIDTLIDRVVTDMYVDDLATSCDDSGEARNLVKKLSDLMRSGGFSLKKWASNDVSALHDLPEEDRLGRGGSGRLWASSGTVAATISPFRCDTKRQLVSLAARVFDPLGCLAPFTDRAKQLFQALGSGALTGMIASQRTSMSCGVDGRKNWTSCPQSESLARCCQRPGSNSSVLSYTSSVTLRKRLTSWIQGDPRRWKPFVSNRVQEILGLTEPHQWRHCPTSDNPADQLSRGCALDRLREDQLWWNGPAWLKDSAERPQEASLFVIMDPSRYGTMERLIRVTAYCFRFVANVRTRPGERKIGTQLSLLELQDAEKRWGPSRIGGIGDPFAALCPFADTEGLLRVAFWRLSRTALPWCHRHPLLLPHDGRVVELIVRRAHESELHAGLNQTLAALRRRFWVVRGCQAVKRCIRACITCRKLAARPFCPLMSDLPPERTTPSFPFNRVGLDFAGPLHVKDEQQPLQKVYICLFTCRVTPAVHLELVMNMTSISFLAAFRRFIAQRGRPSVIQSDNFRTFKQADSFLRTLLHGKSAEKLRDELARRQIDWRYSIDRAPWCGGYWEWMVRSVKNALRKVLGKSFGCISWELHTILCELEARINDRPLTLLSEDPNDCAPLTPAHFLIGRDLASLSTPAASTPAPTNTSGLRRRWRHQQLLMNHMWKRWVEEYLVTLTSQGKWNKIGRQPEKGDLVFLVEDGVPRNRWKLGVITDPLMGSDGVTRSVKVRTARGLLTRPSRSLVLLEPASI
ncbi:hypothetical protein T4B_10138, partial [Trichinella pseudospiralis]